MKDVYCYLKETKSFNKETSQGYFWDDVQILKTPSDSKIITFDTLKLLFYENLFQSSSIISLTLKC
jgi:hypothetical protein